MPSKEQSWIDTLDILLENLSWVRVNIFLGACKVTVDNIKWQVLGIIDYDNLYTKLLTEKYYEEAIRLCEFIISSTPNNSICISLIWEEKLEKAIWLQAKRLFDEYNKNSQLDKAIEICEFMIARENSKPGIYWIISGPGNFKQKPSIWQLRLNEIEEK